MPYLIPWKRSEMVIYRRKIDELCDHFFRDLSDRFCRADLLHDWHMTETKEGYTLEIEMPGLDPKDIDVNVAGETLTIEIEKEAADTGPEGRATELCSAIRQVQLPGGLDLDAIEARYGGGTLKILLPKKERRGRMQIPVRS